jgi:hypothetical protein
LDLSILEEAVLYNALKQYLIYCESCLKNPENKTQLTFIKGEIEIIPDLQKKIKQSYLDNGGDVSRL